jgi:hypothetical protein
LKLSVNIVAGGIYYKAGQELPEDFAVPSHLEAFAVNPDEAAEGEPVGTLPASAPASEPNSRSAGKAMPARTGRP